MQGGTLYQQRPPVRSLETEPLMQTDASRQTRRICPRCNLPIVPLHQQGKSTLKALGKYYHEDSFTCHDCGRPLKPKYFPYREEGDNNEDKEPILLCQYDYFRRHKLLCSVCDRPLRGLYYTAFGKRYDEEHFSCVICHESCGIKKCFMHDGELYCKYHFLKYFAKRCKGCDFPISDQHIEFPKGEEIQCWHPECYGIHKYWHVNLSAETLGLPPFPRLEFRARTTGMNKDVSADSNTDVESVLHPNREELQNQLRTFNFVSSKIWSILYRFEEETAGCISDMFQYLSSFDQFKGIDSTALLVLKIECLFRALDIFDTFNDSFRHGSISQIVSSNGSPVETGVDGIKRKFSKYPRNLTTKIMIYLQLLRKVNSESYSDEKMLPSFMSVITALAHFLKLLTRYGLCAALEEDKNMHSGSIIMKFLREVEKNEAIKSNPFASINVTVTATDNCSTCSKYMQEECVKFGEKRWHIHCLICSSCGRQIALSEISEATYNIRDDRILCPHCSSLDPNSVQGFKFVTKLSQLIFLLKIALVRSKVVMESQFKGNRNRQHDIIDRKRSITMQQTYIRTLNDIKRLRSRRESVPLNNSEWEARKSIVHETPEEDLHERTEAEEQREPSRNVAVRTSELQIVPKEASKQHDNVFNNTKSLTLEDISRIVAAEQARELRPNAFAHFKRLKEVEDDNLAINYKGSGVYYSELKESDMEIIRVISTTLLLSLKSIPTDTFSLSNLEPLIPREKTASQPNSFWSKMKFMMNKEPKRSSPRKVFGTSLGVLASRWGIDSELGVGPSKIRIPIIVDELISNLRQMDMSVEGIFRKNGNIRRLRELTRLIDENPSEVPDLSKENAIQLSALLKKFIRELPEPILTVSLYNLWISSATIESASEKQKVTSLIYSLLPIYNRNLLEVLLSFLYWTSSFSHIEDEMGSKMDIHNLSTVIAPNILYLRAAPNGVAPSDVENGIDPQLQLSLTPLPQSQSQPSASPRAAYSDGFAENEGQHYFLAIEVVNYLITRNEEMVMVPKFLVNLLQVIKSMNIDFTDREKIRRVVLQKIADNDVNYSEFDAKEAMKVKDSSVVAMRRNSMGN